MEVGGGQDVDDIELFIAQHFIDRSVGLRTARLAKSLGEGEVRIANGDKLRIEIILNSARVNSAMKPVPTIADRIFVRPDVKLIEFKGTSPS